MADAEMDPRENGRAAQQSQEERMRQQEDMKNSILSQVLDQGARARLNTLKISRPEKAQMIEQMIISRMGQFGSKMTEENLVQLLETLNRQQAPKTSTVKFDRRRAALDSDSDDDYGL